MRIDFCFAPCIRCCIYVFPFLCRLLFRLKFTSICIYINISRIMIRKFHCHYSIDTMGWFACLMFFMKGQIVQPRRAISIDFANQHSNCYQIEYSKWAIAIAAVICHSYDMHFIFFFPFLSIRTYYHGCFWSFSLWLYGFFSKYLTISMQWKF